jgi:hypothetical protein
VEAGLTSEIVALYGLPPEEFTAARNARAKELKADDAELAAAVAKLPKPTAAAAAVNRLAREEPSEVRALVQSGKRLRAAQEAALAGKSQGAVAAATREHREALERVRREARRLKLSDAVLERVSSTLRVASVDPELQPLLERGALAREAESSGFGLDPGLVAAAPAKRARKRDDGAAKRRAAVRAAQERLRAAKREATAAEQERRRAERDLRAAEQAAERAHASVEEAEEALERARR